LKITFFNKKVGTTGTRRVVSSDLLW